MDSSITTLSYSLRRCSNGVRTRKLSNLLKVISDVNNTYHDEKKLIDFQFFKTVYDEKYEYDLIVFKEVNLDGP